MIGVRRSHAVHPDFDAVYPVDRLHDVLSEADFKDFVFTNPARLYQAVNPRFFEGTPVEAHVSSLLVE